ncbi:MAG: hypothetical protein E7311_00715 [Clostridiales bacterium]|nr:hypothetical protein [Clostridiales bacterium]
MKKKQKIIYVTIFFILMCVTLVTLFMIDTKTNQYVLTVDGISVEVDEFNIFAKIIKNNIEEEYIEKRGNTDKLWTSELYGMNAEQYLREETIKLIIRNIICEQKCIEFGVNISQEKVDEITLKVKNDANVKKLIDKIAITEQQYIDYLIKEERFTILSNYLTDNMIITNSEAKAYVEDLGNGSIYIVKRMIFSTKEKDTLADKYTPEQKEEIYLKANTVLEKLNNGESFNELALEYSDVISTYKPGDEYVYIDGNAENKKIEEVAKTLQIGKNSTVIETTQGYEIILLEKIITPDEYEYLNKIKELMFETQKYEIVKNEFEKWYRLSSIEKNISVINNIKVI